MPPSFFEQIFLLLTTNPGNLAYHLVLAFSTAGVLTFTLIQSSKSATMRRMSLGLALLLALRLSLFLAAALAWQNILDVTPILPPLDRAVALLSILVVIWLWAFSAPHRAGDAASLLLGLLVVTLAVLGSIWWSQQGTSTFFNGSWLDTTSAALGAFLCLSGMIILALSRPEGWGTGFGMLGLLLAGQAVHYFAPLPQGDFSGAIRLSQMAAFPLLFALAQQMRYPAAPLQQPVEPDAEAGVTPQTTSLEVIHSFLELAEVDAPDHLPLEIARLVSNLMNADICLMVELPHHSQQMLVRSGYNRSKDQEIQSYSVSSQLSYTIGNAIRQRPILRLPASSTVGDELGQGLSLTGGQLGHLLAVPLPLAGSTNITGLILLAPYARRGWTSSDEEHLMTLASLLARFLDQSHAWRQAVKTPPGTAGLQQQLEQIQHENEILLSELEEARQVASQANTRAESLAALLASGERNSDFSDNSEADLEQEKRSRESEQQRFLQETERIKSELHLALEEIAHLKSSISDTELRLLEQQLKPGEAVSSENQGEAAASIARDLRQPLASIAEYLDALASETRDNLEARPRKYLERIRASVERMGGMVDDLLHATQAPARSAAAAGAQSTNFNAVVDEAVALIMGQVREKNIVFRLDIPQDLPAIQVQREALQQIVVHLLQNASSASPEGGVISLQAKIRSQTGQPEQVLIQVSNSGEGIPPEALPKVFSRLQQSQTPIRGLGDSAFRLTAAKSLVEAQGGQIWVDSELEKGSTFSVLLPGLPQKGSNNGHEIGQA